MCFGICVSAIKEPQNLVFCAMHSGSGDFKSGHNEKIGGKTGLEQKTAHIPELELKILCYS
jgi:hypothetical protein